MYKIIFIVLFTMLSFSEDYNVELDPTAFVSGISISEFMGEFDNVSKILNGNLSSDNFLDGALTNADILTNDLTTTKILNGTLVAADFANIGNIASGSLIYASGDATLNELAIGTNGYVLTIDSGMPSWQSENIPWTDSSGNLYPATSTRNVVIGGSDAGASSERVWALVNGTAPTASITDGVQIYAKDVEDSDTKLLCHLNGTDGSTPTDIDETGNHTPTWYSTAQLDTSAKKFGTASLLVDGNSDYITFPDSSDWDILSSLVDDWTIDFWVKHSSTSGSQTYISQREDNNNYWAFRNDSGSGLVFFFQSGGSNIVITSYGGEITDTSWHHIALCKVANDFAIYKDGTKVAEDLSVSSTDTLSGILSICARNDASAYFAGNIDEVRIINDNYFNVDPTTSGTLTVPTSEYTIGTYSYLHIRDEAGNETIKSPHAFPLITKSEDMAWSYLSSRDGKMINVDMLKFIRGIEKLSGKQFVFERNSDG